MDDAIITGLKVGRADNTTLTHLAPKVGSEDFIQHLVDALFCFAAPVLFLSDEGIGSRYAHNAMSKYFAVVVEDTVEKGDSAETFNFKIVELLFKHSFDSRLPR